MPLPDSMRRGLYFEEIEPGRRFSSPSRTVTEADIIAFAGQSGDFNLIHTDAAYAAQGPFGQRVAPGFAVVSPPARPPRGAPGVAGGGGRGATPEPPPDETQASAPTPRRAGPPPEPTTDDLPRRGPQGGPPPPPGGPAGPARRAT